MNKRIMTVDELYTFCLQNNFSKFDSNETGSEIVVEMPGLFEKSDDDSNKFSEGMTPFVSRAFHDKINLNKSNIKTETFKDNLPSSHLRPILANIKKDEETGLLDFGSHDYHIEKVTEIDENGNEISVEKTVYDEQPIGVIDGSKNSIEYDKKADVNRAVLHGYLYDGYCQDAIDILNRRGTVDCSVELSIRSMSFDASTKTLVLDDFYVSALTLLSAKTKPGMAGSNFKIEDFEANENEDRFSYDEKIIGLLENLSNMISKFNNNTEPTQDDLKKGGGNKNMNKIEELLNKYNKTIDDITFEYDEMSDEELEVKFAEMFDDDSVDEGDSEDGKSDGDSDKGDDEVASEENFSKDTLFNKLFEISFDEIRYALNALCSIYRNDSEWCYVSRVYDNYFIMEDWDNDKFYKQFYTRDGDNVTLSGERIEVFAMLLTESEKLSIEEMRSNYAELKEFKENVEKNELLSKKEEILNSEKYAVLDQKDEEGKFINEAYAKLVSEIDNYSLADLETQIKVIHSDFVSEHSEFSASEVKKEKETVSKKQFANVQKKASKPSRYGKLFSK